MRLIPVLLAVLSLGGVLAGCSDEEPIQPDQPESAEPQTPIDEATVDQLVNNPNAYDGATVIVRDAQFVPIEPEGGFVLEGREGSRILVSAPRGIPEQLQEGESVPVRAELVRFTQPAAEALGQQFADAEELAETPTDVGDPYLLLRALPETGGGASAPSDAQLDDERAELASVVTDAEQRYGDRVSVAGELVRAGQAAFVLEAEGERLLIVPQSIPVDVPETGATVRAQGEVERLPGPDDPEVVRETNLFNEFEGQPTLAADSFQVVNG